MRRRAAIATPGGVVQVIRLHWSKSSRGGQGPRDRNGVPLGFEVPPDLFLGPAGSLVVSESHWSERDAFAEPLAAWRRVMVADGYCFGGVSVGGQPGGLLVHCRYDHVRDGAPGRRFFSGVTGAAGLPGRALTVRAGEWVRVCYNGRFSCVDDGTWWYEQVTVNVAWFDGELDGRIFLDRKPAREVLMLADLR